MMDILKYLKEEYLIRNNINLQNKKVVIAVSTGVDSMVLLHTFLELQKDSDFEVICAHVNHNKRLQSMEEEKYIRSFCEERNIKLYVKSLDFSSNVENFQKAARDLRYDFFKEVLDLEKADYLALAHHGNDNMETILMRIIRGSSLMGYSGMSEVMNFHSYNIIRPFLGILKKDILEYQNVHKIKYYEDESNAKDLYTRNRIRKDVIPGLLLEGENVNSKFLEFSKTIKQACSELNKIRDDFINEKIEKTDRYISFSKKDLLSLSKYMQNEVVFEILKPCNLGQNNIDEIFKLINSNKANIEVVYKKNLSFVKEYDKIYFFFEELKKTDGNYSVIINGLGEYQINDTISIIVTKKSANYITNMNSLWYNIDKLPIIVRSRKPSDKIKLSNGYKKVKDLLIDLKIGILQRKNVLVVENRDNEILAVLGIKKSVILEADDNNILITTKEKKNG